MPERDCKAGLQLEDPSAQHASTLNQSATNLQCWVAAVAVVGVNYIMKSTRQ